MKSRISPRSKLALGLLVAGSAVAITTAVLASAGGGATQRHPLALTSKAATDACTSSSDGYWQAAEASTEDNATLAGAYTMTAGSIGPWVTALPGAPGSQFANDPSSQTVYVCYFAGTFKGISTASTPPNQEFQTMLVAIPEGSPPELLLYGPSVGSLSFGPPSSTS